jgi:2-polyprenyl-6-methoxyphenol hydroxylase-like FAD-dependent oxidoreductase
MDTDVLVVGAGPVGLMMAAELRRHGVHCRIIDALAAPARYCKAVGIQPRTLEIWDQLGLVTQAIDAGIWLRGLRIFANGQEIKRVDIDLSDLPYGFLSLPQDATERLLTRHLATFGTAVERPVTLQAFDQMGGGVTATLAQVDGPTETVHCRYLVGCDGAHSIVRHGLGLSFEGGQLPQEFMIGDVDVEWALPPGYSYRFMHVVEHQTDDILICVPLPGSSRYRLSMLLPAAGSQTGHAGAFEHGLLTDRPAPTLTDIQAVIERLAPAGTRVRHLRWSSVFRISHRIVPQYHVGRVFLAGDAAHIHPPTGGQGMNTGLQDAYNLAWKLALAVRGVAAGDLLESYTAERWPVGRAVVDRTRARATAPQGAFVDEGRDALMQDAQLLLNYRSSAWVGEDLAMPEALTQGPQPGDRAPDAGGLRRAGVGHPLRLCDLRRGTAHTLLVSLDRSAKPPGSDTAARGLADLAAALRVRYGDRVEVYGITTPGGAAVTVEGVPVVEDTAGEFRRGYDVKGMSAYLVRPDGYVGYRAHPLQWGRLDAYLRRIVRGPHRTGHA